MNNYELKDLKIREVDKEYARRFIKKYHYSKQCPGIVLAVGEWIGTELKNCIVFNYCIGREMANEVWGGDNSNTIELARMVSLEPKPKNMESYCIKRALDFLKKAMPNIQVVISYADNQMGHKGYCYQASNFVYYGQSRPTTHWFVDGVRTHEKTLNNKYGTTSKEKLKGILGDRLTFEQCFETKSRYYYILASNKREKKEISKQIKVESYPYPKGDNQRYDMYAIGSFATNDEELAKQKDKTKLVYQLNIFDIMEE